jgi:sulfate adenylyltransferase subunit 1
MNTFTSDTHDNSRGDSLGLLRFITAGSVDDGKSTLIGRLLYDSKGIFADQLSAITRSKHKRTVGDLIDLSLLTDGLEAEREQGITIDVAYRYFATPARKFIIADTPGHEQYTRNMVTGASTADAAIILIDPTRIWDEATQSVTDLLAQTKRHSALAHLLGVRHLIVAVNKMDLVNYRQDVFEAICAAYAQLAQQLGISEVHYIPLSALAGDNVVHPTVHMPWFTGDPLLTVLENLPNQTDARDLSHAPLRFPVQLVARHNGHQADDFRGYMGRVESGVISVGQAITVQPAGHTATVKQILFYNTELTEAKAGQSVTILLNEDVDISRGDTLTAAEDSQVQTGRQLTADLCWLDSEPLNVARKYWLKQGTKVVQAKVQQVVYTLDITTLTHQQQSTQSAQPVTMNTIARVQLQVQQPLLLDDYTALPATGCFVLMDSAIHQTCAAGMIRLA